MTRTVDFTPVRFLIYCKLYCTCTFQKDQTICNNLYLLKWIFFCFLAKLFTSTTKLSYDWHFLCKINIILLLLLWHLQEFQVEQVLTVLSFSNNSKIYWWHFYPQQIPTSHTKMNYPTKFSTWVLAPFVFYKCYILHNFLWWNILTRIAQFQKISITILHVLVGWNILTRMYSSKKYQ